MKKWLMIAVALVAAVGAGLWLRGGGNEQAPQVAFSSLAGQASSMEQLRGKVVSRSRVAPAQPPARPAGKHAGASAAGFSLEPICLCNVKSPPGRRRP